MEERTMLRKIAEIFSGGDVIGEAYGEYVEGHWGDYTTSGMSLYRDRVEYDSSVTISGKSGRLVFREKHVPYLRAIGDLWRERSPGLAEYRIPLDRFGSGGGIYYYPPKSSGKGPRLIAETQDTKSEDWKRTERDVFGRGRGKRTCRKILKYGGFSLRKTAEFFTRHEKTGEEYAIPGYKVLLGKSGPEYMGTGKDETFGKILPHDLDVLEELLKIWEKRRLLYAAS